MLDPEDQQLVTQLLVYLLPPCNSDTLQRLLEFLHTVAQHAQNGYDKDGQEVRRRPNVVINIYLNDYKPFQLSHVHGYYVALDSFDIRPISNI